MTGQLEIGMLRDAEFSPCRTWRYTLSRIWEPAGEACMFVGLNPSTADESLDDPTVRRCIRFARDWGYGGLRMLNLYGFRATYPRDLHAAREPIGPDTDEWLAELARHSGLVVAAWGADPGPYLGRPARVRELLGDVSVLGFTQQGQPRHPLYMRADCQPQPWSAA